MTGKRSLTEEQRDLVMKAHQRSNPAIYEVVETRSLQVVPLDEIPNQLRLRASRKCADGYAIPFDIDLDNLAADEIVRLRLALTEARRALDIARSSAAFYKDGVLIAAFDEHGRQIHAHKVIRL